MSRSGKFIGALFAAAVGVACTPSTGQNPGQADGGPPPNEDGGSPLQDGGVAEDGSVESGLRLAFHSDPTLPGGDVGGGVDGVLNDATVELRDVQAIADSANDDRTRQHYLLLHWGEGDDGHEIFVDFDTAPPGIYSEVSAVIMSYQMAGTVVVSEGNLPFEIVDTSPPPLSITVSLDDFELLPGTNRTISIRVRVRDAVREVPWDSVVPDGDDVLRIDSTDSAEIAIVRQEMANAFEAEEDDGEEEDD